MIQFLPFDADAFRSENGERSTYIRSLRTIVLDVGPRAVQLQQVDGGERFVFVPDRFGQAARRRRPDAVPGEVLRVRPRRARSFGKIRFIVGELLDRGLDVEALGLTPLQLFGRGQWGPLVRRDHIAPVKGDGSGDGAAAAESVMRRDLLLELVQGTGPRPAFEMERVDFDEAGADGQHARALVDGDAIGEGSARMALDLRCLDWHAHLGLDAFRGNTRNDLALAIRHYRVGVAIGDLTVGEAFEGVLSWSYAGNRPYLRCLHGLGLCWWRLGEPERAAEVFRRLLWLDPEDPLDTRPLLKQLDLRFTWEQSYTAQNGPVLVESLAGR